MGDRTYRRRRSMTVRNNIGRELPMTTITIVIFFFYNFIVIDVIPIPISSGFTGNARYNVNVLII